MFSEMNMMSAIGYLLCAAGILTAILGELRFLAIVFRQGPGWLLSCLLLPFAGSIFFLFNIRTTLKPVAIQLAGLAILLLGCYLAGPVTHRTWH